jgi:hypothetical protein
MTDHIRHSIYSIPLQESAIECESFCFYRKIILGLIFMPLHKDCTGTYTFDSTGDSITETIIPVGSNYQQVFSQTGYSHCHKYSNVSAFFNHDVFPYYND